MGDLQQSEVLLNQYNSIKSFFSIFIKFQFNYDIEAIQLRFLRILSEQGSQYVIFDCHNTNIDILNHDIKLRTKNGMIYHKQTNGDDTLRYDIIKHDCKVISLLLFIYKSHIILLLIFFLSEFFWPNNTLYINE